MMSTIDMGFGGLGKLLKAFFAASIAQPLPRLFEDLLARLEAGENASAPQALTDEAFKTELSALIPQLRGYGRWLTGSQDLVDDLVQETMMRAWVARERYRAGTNMRAWTFIILRNLFLSEMRRNRFKGEWNDLTADRVLTTQASQQQGLNLGDLQRAMQQLPASQREALILVGAGGVAYDEAAVICGVALGTIKSRVSRGRTALEAILSQGLMPSRTDDPDDGRSAFDAIADELSTLTGAV